MSYILDALRKSQQLRHPGPAPASRGAVHNISLSLPGRGWWLVAGLILLLGMLAAALIFWRSTVGNVPPAAPVTSAAGTPVTKPEPVVAEKTPPPAENTAPTGVVRDLADEAKVPIRIAPKPPSAARASRKAVVPRRRAMASYNVPAEPLVPDDTPLLQQMPAEFQRALPPLTVTIHVYAQPESQRILFINNREYHQGDRIAGGIRVEEIVPDGVVLSYQGQRFKLSRPR